jgi:hypothetical protein
VGDEIDYGNRIYDPRRAGFDSVDPLIYTYPWLTPYQFAGNTPIEAIDIDGLEPYKMAYKFADNPNPILNLFHSDNVINMAEVKNPTSFNSLGWGRQPQYFWDQYQNTPLGKEALSTDNLIKINDVGQSPTVDEQWNTVMRQFGNDGKIDEVIHHHHLNKGANAIPIPASRHIGADAEEEMHSMNLRGGTVSQRFGKNLSKSFIFFDIMSILQNSPNSVVYTFHQIGTLNENRAYPTNDANAPAPYYEWKWTGKPNESLREVTYFKDYNYVKGNWRGVGKVGKTSYYDKNGKEVQLQ